jgi:AraC-like DNA-binding protein
VAIAQVLKTMAADLTPIKKRPQPQAVFVAPEFVAGLVSGLKGRQVDIEGHLRRVGADPLLLHTPGHPGVTATQFVALFYDLLHDTRDEALGLFSRPLKPGAFALMARQGLYAPDLRRALKRVAETLNLLQDDVLVALQTEGDLAGLSMQAASPGRPTPFYAQQTLVRILWRLSAWLINVPMPVRHFAFTVAAPPDHPGLDAVFPGAKRYGQAAFGFWFSAAQLRTPVSRNEAALQAFVRDAFTHVVAPPRNFGPLAQKTRQGLTHSLPQWPTLEQVAKALHMAPSTLQRRLAQEGTSLQWLRDDLRRDIAISRLSTSRVSLVQLALELGFSDSPSFQRAFKRWTGQQCSAYRRSPR